MAKICDFCSTSSAAVHCKADAAHLCLSCDAKLHSANQVVNRHPHTILYDSCNYLSAYVGCLDRGSGDGGIELMCHLCDQNHHVTTSQVHQRLSINSYTGCPAAEDLAAIWGLQMNHDHTNSTSHVGSLDILGQILDLQIIQTTVPLGRSNTTSQLRSEKMQDQLGVCDDDSNIPDDEYLAFLNLEELIGDEDDQDLIVRTQKLLDDHGNINYHNLDTAAASMDGPRESSSIPVNGSLCSPCSSVLCNTLSSSVVSHSVKGEQVFDARANAVMRYKQKKHSRVYERKIRYQKRKAIADTRKRVRGRFASN
ncbi:zinc finger protein CONSTANS-LIKE 15-like [Rosa sericea]